MPNHRRTFGQSVDRTDAHRLEDLRRVERQVRSIITTRDDPAFEERLISDIQQRRSGSRRIPFAWIPDKYGGNTLAAAGKEQLLVRAEDDERVRALLEGPRYNLNRQVVEGLDNRVVAYSSDEVTPDTLANLASSLRKQGLPVSANYMTPLGGRVKAVASPENTEGATPQFPEAEANASIASPVRVIVIDTGVHGRARRDGWLQDLETDENGEVLDDSPPGGDGFLDLAAGHGSFCAGIVQQIAPAADIKVYNPIDSDGFVDELKVATELVKQVRKGLEDGKDVVANLSFGAETADDERPVALGVALEIIDEASREFKHDVLVVAAAGNFGHNRECYPAAFPTVTAVAALTQDLTPAAWSSRGAWVDVCTIGEGVRSTFVPGTESPVTDPRSEVFPDNAWALWSGTSFAAPQVAGAIAKIAIDDGVAPTEAKRRLLEGAHEIPLYGKQVEILPRI
ncbi:MAG TPA: S8/S53 family peptidase [Jiangellaceae bacterium]|nr:S8/S53 family peptidase [Jiangellaceae bacterium]